jgi:hypothetical protein
MHSPLDCNCTAPAAPVCNNVKARDPLEILDIDIEGTSARRRVLRLYKSKLDNVVAILEVEKVFKEGSGSVVGKSGRLCGPCGATFVVLVPAPSSCDDYLRCKQELLDSLNSHNIALCMFFRSDTTTCRRNMQWLLCTINSGREELCLLAIRHLAALHIKCNKHWMATLT